MTLCLNLETSRLDQVIFNKNFWHLTGNFGTLTAIAFNCKIPPKCTVKETDACFKISKSTVDHSLLSLTPQQRHL